jgi:hypothetical protein
MNCGRTFSVRKDGTLSAMAKNPDADIEHDTSLFHTDRPPMKIIVSRATSIAFKEHLKFPSSRVSQSRKNINDSLNIRDFLEYGAKDSSGCREPSYASSVDVRKWK